MRLVTRIAIAAAAVTSFAFSEGGNAADTRSGFYLANSPGSAVQYLSLNDSGREVGGFLESIRASSSASDGQERRQTFVRRSGNTLYFGTYTATRSGDGYTMTSMTRKGRIVQLHFVRSNVQAVNAAVAALSTSVSHRRARSEQMPTGADVRSDDSISADDAARLDKAQLALDSAAAQLKFAQGVADRFSALARQARITANAAIETSGVSPAQNKGRLEAMNAADNAELNANAANRTVDLAAATVAYARAEVALLRSHLAETTRSPRASSAPNDRVGP